LIGTGNTPASNDHEEPGPFNALKFADAQDREFLSHVGNYHRRERRTAARKIGGRGRAAVVEVGTVPDGFRDRRRVT
jgi:hypothetical protein